MLPHGQTPRNGVLKVGIFLVLTALIVGAAEIADNWPAISRTVSGWFSARAVSAP
jgi:hypothetical protein